MIKLNLPLKDIYVTQKFGVNYYDFYQKLGMVGHNGIDFRTKRGCPVMATHDGVVTWAGIDGGGGISVTLWSKEYGFKTIYYHLQEVKCEIGQEILTGEVIGLADNTGQMTTGDHLHFGLKFVDQHGQTTNYDNEYKGGIDPAQFFPKNWQEPPAYHRYGRPQNYLRDYQVRFKNAWLHRQLIARGRHPLSLKTEELNAIVYGGWGFDEVMNDSLRETWAYRKKYDDNHYNIFNR